MRRESGLRAQSRINPRFNQSTQYTTWWSDQNLVKRVAGFRAQHRTLCVTGRHVRVSAGRLLPVWGLHCSDSLLSRSRRCQLGVR